LHDFNRGPLRPHPSMLEPPVGSGPFQFTRWLFPARMVADHVGVLTSVIRFWLTPWQRRDEHLPMSHIAEVTHLRGLIWDQISVESSGGLNPLVIPGLPKGASSLLCGARARAPQRNRGYPARASSSLNLSPCVPSSIARAPFHVTFSHKNTAVGRISKAIASCTRP
jgi:hypothetical protein